MHGPASVTMQRVECGHEHGHHPYLAFSFESGKSNILRFVHFLDPKIRQRRQVGANFCVVEKPMPTSPIAVHSSYFHISNDSLTSWQNKAKRVVRITRKSVIPGGDLRECTEIIVKYLNMHRIRNFVHSCLFNICLNNFASESCWSEKPYSTILYTIQFPANFSCFRPPN